MTGSSKSSIMTTNPRPADSAPDTPAPPRSGATHPGGEAMPREPNALSLILRGSFGGALMGLANLVPGISGGTMLLAVGIYPRFITAVGEVTTLRFRRRSLITLGAVVLAALVAVALLAGPVKDLVVAQRWVMYSLFIGLTLGGVPVLWRLIGRPTPTMWLGAAVGLAGMVALGLSQQLGLGGDGRQEGFAWMLLAGAAAAAAGILPGVSGGYLLLVLGVYVPLLAAVDGFKDAAAAGEAAALWQIGGSVILPVAIGIALGVGLISNLLRWLLSRFEKPTLGVLLGLLLGAVVGLYPFQQTAKPNPGDTLKGQTVVQTEAGTLALEADDGGKQRALKPEDYPTQLFTPRWYHLGAVGGLIVAGFAMTWLIDQVGQTGRRDRSPEA
jgi:putative membrane protein